MSGKDAEKKKTKKKRGAFLTFSKKPCRTRPCSDIPGTYLYVPPEHSSTGRAERWVRTPSRNWPPSRGLKLPVKRRCHSIVKTRYSASPELCRKRREFLLISAVNEIVFPVLGNFDSSSSSRLSTLRWALSGARTHTPGRSDVIEREDRCASGGSGTRSRLLGYSYFTSTFCRTQW